MSLSKRQRSQLATHGSIFHEETYALIRQGVSGQARLWSYIDDFRYLALVCFGCIPIVFRLKKSVGQKGALRAGH